MLGVGLNYGSGWGFCFDVGFGFGVCLYFWFLCLGCFLKLRVFGVEWWSFVFWSSEGYVLG